MSWPVVFITWSSKVELAHEQATAGRVRAQVLQGKHIRKGASFILVAEDGRIVASGTVVSSKDDEHHELRIGFLAARPEDVVQLQNGHLSALKSIKGKRPPLSAFVIGDNESPPLDHAWFAEVLKLIPPSLPSSLLASLPSDAGLAASFRPKSTSNNPPYAAPASREAAPERDSDDMLVQWLPPIIKGLLAEHVRADLWEDVVANAFTAIGMHVEVHGKNKPGTAVQDLTARFVDPASGATIELIVDAKAGKWNAPVDSLRAMRDYMAHAPGYRYPLFVAGRLGPDVTEKLSLANIPNKTPVAVDGPSLARLVVTRLTNADFNVFVELQRLLRL